MCPCSARNNIFHSRDFVILCFRNVLWHHIYTSNERIRLVFASYIGLVIYLQLVNSAQTTGTLLSPHQDTEVNHLNTDRQFYHSHQRTDGSI